MLRKDLSPSQILRLAALALCVVAGCKAESDGERPAPASRAPNRGGLALSGAVAEADARVYLTDFASLFQAHDAIRIPSPPILSIVKRGGAKPDVTHCVAEIGTPTSKTGQQRAMMFYVTPDCPLDATVTEASLANVQQQNSEGSAPPEYALHFLPVAGDTIDGCKGGGWTDLDPVAFATATKGSYDQLAAAIVQAGALAKVSGNLDTGVAVVRLPGQRTAILPWGSLCFSMSDAMVPTLASETSFQTWMDGWYSMIEASLPWMDVDAEGWFKYEALLQLRLSPEGDPFLMKPGEATADARSRIAATISASVNSALAGEATFVPTVYYDEASGMPRCFLYEVTIRRQPADVTIAFDVADVATPASSGTPSLLVPSQWHWTYGSRVTPVAPGFFQNRYALAHFKQTFERWEATIMQRLDRPFVTADDADAMGTPGWGLGCFAADGHCQLKKSDLTVPQNESCSAFLDDLVKSRTVYAP